MIDTSSVSKFNDTVVVVTARLSEHLIKKAIELSKEGYKVVEGSTRVGSTLAQVCMEKVNPFEGTGNIDPESIPDEVQEAIKDIPNDIPVVQDPPLDNTVDVPPMNTSDSDPVKELDEQLIKSFKKDKNKLEDYGKEFGIDLKKNKSFANMLKDLKAHVKGD